MKTRKAQYLLDLGCRILAHMTHVPDLAELCPFLGRRRSGPAAEQMLPDIFEAEAIRSGEIEYTARRNKVADPAQRGENIYPQMLEYFGEDDAVELLVEPPALIFDIALNDADSKRLANTGKALGIEINCRQLGSLIFARSDRLE